MSTQSVDPQRESGRWPRRLGKLAVAVLLLLAVLALLFVSVSPSVEAGARPTARDIQAARGVWAQLKEARSADRASAVRIDSRAVRGLAALASDAIGLAKFEGEVTGGVLTGKASVDLPAGLWVNVAASVSGRHTGFPEYRLTVGRVTFPRFAGRWAAQAGRWMLRTTGADVPPLDTLVRRVTVNRQDVVAELSLPEDSDVVDGLISAGGNDLDQWLVSDIYCRLAAAQRKAPLTELPQLIRRTFADPQARPTEAYNRAAFVAVALLVVGERAEALADEAGELKKRCNNPPAALVLHGREDLAKHWTFSAALAATLGEETAKNLGEWKELDDSLANGSGFSFVDIAADRSGMQTALRALDPATAKEALAHLRLATEDGMLPPALLETPEGLAETSFVDRYGSLDQTRYQQAIAAIDRVLARD